MNLLVIFQFIVLQAQTVVENDTLKIPEKAKPVASTWSGELTPLILYGIVGLVLLIFFFILKSNSKKGKSERRKYFKK